MKKLLIGSFVLFGLLIASCFPANVKADEATVLAAIKELKGDIKEVQADVEKLKSKSKSSKKKDSDLDSNHDFSARINETLSGYYKERRKAKEERELAEALQCLLDKAKTNPCACSTTVPACEYVKPNCAPIQCLPTPFSSFSR